MPALAYAEAPAAATDRDAGNRLLADLSAGDDAA